MRPSVLRAVLVVAALGATTAVSYAAGSESASISAEPRSTVDASQPRLPAIPGDARLTVAQTQGSGTSDVIEFTPRAKTYTVAITCSSAGGATPAVIYDLGYPDDPIPISCDGIPNSWSIGGTVDTQRLQVRAPEDAEWVFAVYDGAPSGVTVAASK